MTPQFHANPFAPALSFWCSLWQAQLEQSLKFWGAFAQYVPHESAADLAAEAEMMKPALRTERSSGPKTAKRAAAKPVEAAKPVDTAPAPEKAPTRAPRTTPAKAKAGSEDPAKPVVH